MLAVTINYSGHTISDDGHEARLYRLGELVGTYSTLAAAKAQATRRWRTERAQWAAEHHARLTASTIDPQ